MNDTLATYGLDQPDILEEATQLAPDLFAALVVCREVDATFPLADYQLEELLHEVANERDAFTWQSLPSQNSPQDVTALAEAHLARLDTHITRLTEIRAALVEVVSNGSSDTGTHETELDSPAMQLATLIALYAEADTESRPVQAQHGQLDDEEDRADERAALFSIAEDAEECLTSTEEMDN